MKISCEIQLQQQAFKNRRHVLKLYPYKIIRIIPRCEAIIEASTINNMGVIQAEKAQPRVFIGNYLVQPKNHLCLNIIITTEM